MGWLPVVLIAFRPPVSAPSRPVVRRNVPFVVVVVVAAAIEMKSRPAEERLHRTD